MDPERPHRHYMAMHINHLLTRWWSLTAQLARQAELASPNRRSDVLESIRRWEETDLPKVKELRDRHYYVDESVQGAQQMTADGLPAGAKLRGTEKYEDLLALWRECRQLSLSLDLAEERLWIDQRMRARARAERWRRVDAESPDMDLDSSLSPEASSDISEDSEPS